MIEISPKRNTMNARWQPLPFSPARVGPPALRQPASASASAYSLGQGLRSSPVDGRLYTLLLGGGAVATGAMIAYEMRGRRTYWPTIGIVVAIMGGIKFLHDMANLR